jgi:hypothetical protein
MENREVVSLLVKLGADINAVDATGGLIRSSFTTVLCSAFVHITNGAFRQAPSRLL